MQVMDMQVQLQSTQVLLRMLLLPLTMSVGFVRRCELNTCIVAGFSEASNVNTATFC